MYLLSYLAPSYVKLEGRNKKHLNTLTVSRTEKMIKKVISDVGPL